MYVWKWQLLSSRISQLYSVFHDKVGIDSLRLCSPSLPTQGLQALSEPSQVTPEGRSTWKTPANPSLRGLFPNFSFIPQHSQSKCLFTGLCAELKSINDLNWGKESAWCLIQLGHQGIAELCHSEGKERVEGEPGALDMGLGCRTQNVLTGEGFGV